MHAHDLGSLCVESSGLPIALHGRRLRSAMSVLLVNVNEKVRTDLLIDAVWGAEPSPRAPAALDTLMWRLRRVLDPDRSARTSSALLRTEENGYRLTLARDEVDSWQFDAAAREVAAARGPRDPAATLTRTEAALGLWRGRPYDDVEDHGWLEARRARLTEQHLLIQQARIGALLDAGQPEQAVTELVPVLAEHAHVERLWAFRMLGLYRSGRAGAALEAYGEVRKLLDRDLGMPPGPELQALQHEILRHDPSLSGPPLAAAARGVVRLPRHRLTLVGRAEDVDAVDTLLHRHRLVSITGPVGAGKTRLAVAVAEQAQPRFADGVYFVDLSEVSDDRAVTARVQETLGIEGDAIDSAAHVVAAFLADRDVLLVLDNCEQVTAAVSAQAAAVLAQDGPTRILVTSRRVLDRADEVVYGLSPLRLPAGSDPSELVGSPAVTLFVDRAASRGVTIDLHGPQSTEVARICHAVDGLPLAIELAAARARTFELHEIATSVIDHPMSLGPATRRGCTEESTLRESIDWSHSALTDQQRIAHRRLSVLPPRFTLEAARAVCSGTYLSEEEVPAALIGLVGESLLEAIKPERLNGPSLFRQLVPIRAHASQRLAAAGEAATTDRALFRWISDTVAHGPRMGQGEGGGLDLLLEDNRRTITAALDAEIAAGPSDEAVITLCRLVPYWWLDGKLSLETVRLVAAAATAVGPANSDFVSAAAVAANGSFLTISQQSTSSTAPTLVEAVQRVAVAPDEWAVFAAELLIAIAAACWVGGDMAAAGAAADGAAAYGERLGDDHLRVLAKAVRGPMGILVDPAAAGKAARSVLDECLKIGNVSAAIMCYHTLYMAALFAQDGPAGLHWSAEALRCQQRIGQRNSASTIEARGSLHVLAGNSHEAIRCYGSANFQYARLGRTWPQIPGTDDLIAVARSQVSARDFDQTWASGERLAASNSTDAWT